MTQEKNTVLVPGKMMPRVIERLKEAFDVVVVDDTSVAQVPPELAQSVRGIALHGNLPIPFMDSFPNLEIVANFGVGYDGVPAGHAASRGIVVTNTPDVLNEEVADTTIGLLLNTLRQLPRAEQWLRQGSWGREGPFPFTPLTLRGRTVGIYGLGRIGLAIARRLEGFDVKIAYHTRQPREELAYTYYPTLKEMAEAVDTIIVIVPGTPATAKAINAEILDALGPDGVLINVGRGTTVDEAALIDALKRGVIAGAGLDVFENEPQVPEELIALPNVSLLPHVGSASQATRGAMADLVADNMISWFATGQALTPVPETPFTRSPSTSDAG